jgi:serine/threonine-protein kinase HipA
MAKKPRFSGALQVMLNGRGVGILERAKSGAISFVYDEQWLSWEHAFPVSLSLPLQRQRLIGEPVIAVFENLLPDNIDIRKRLAARTQADGTDAFSLLAKIGRDCVGALQFLPSEAAIEPVGRVEGHEIDEATIAALLRDLSNKPLGVGITDERDFRISIAGAQEKTALLRKGGHWFEPIGATPTTHILKPQIGKTRDGMDMSHSVENEYFCLRLCAALGMPTALTEILDFEEVRVLSVERFDRVWTDDGRLLRLPQEDFCQALGVPPTIKYNVEGGPGIVECLRFLKTSNNPEADQRMFLKAQIIFWLMAATDGHAKNYSVFLEPGERFRMTPLYDVLSAQPNYDAHEMRRRELKLAMAVGNRRNYGIYKIAPRHFGQSAKLAALSPDIANDIFEEVRVRMEDALQETFEAMPKYFPMELADSVASGMRLRLAQLV